MSWVTFLLLIVVLLSSVLLRLGELHLFSKATVWHVTVANSIPGCVIVILRWHNPSGRTMALGLKQPLAEMSTRNISWGVKAAGAYDWQPYHLHAPIVLTSGSLNLLQPLGPVRGLLYRDVMLVYRVWFWGKERLQRRNWCAFCIQQPLLAWILEPPDKTVDHISPDAS